MGTNVDSDKRMATIEKLFQLGHTRQQIDVLITTGITAAYGELSDRGLVYDKRLRSWRSSLVTKKEQPHKLPNAARATIVVMCHGQAIGSIKENLVLAFDLLGYHVEKIGEPSLSADNVNYRIVITISGV